MPISFTHFFQKPPTQEPLVPPRVVPPAEATIKVVRDFYLDRLPSDKGMKIDPIHPKRSYMGIILGLQDFNKCTNLTQQWIYEKFLDIAEGIDIQFKDEAKEIINGDRLVKNFGFANAILLLGRGLQVAHEMTKIGGRKDQPSFVNSAELFDKALNKVIEKNPLEAQKLDLNELVFVQKEVNPLFLRDLKDAERERQDARRKTVTRVAIGALLLFGGVWQGYNYISNCSKQLIPSKTTLLPESNLIPKSTFFSESTLLPEPAKVLSNAPASQASTIHSSPLYSSSFTEQFFQSYQAEHAKAFWNGVSEKWDQVSTSLSMIVVNDAPKVWEQIKDTTHAVSQPFSQLISQETAEASNSLENETVNEVSVVKGDKEPAQDKPSIQHQSTESNYLWHGLAAFVMVAVAKAAQVICFLKSSKPVVQTGPNNAPTLSLEEAPIGEPPQRELPPAIVSLNLVPPPIVPSIGDRVQEVVKQTPSIQDKFNKFQRSSQKIISNSPPIEEKSDLKEQSVVRKLDFDIEYEFSDYPVLLNLSPENQQWIQAKEEMISIIERSNPETFVINALQPGIREFIPFIAEVTPILMKEDLKQKKKLERLISSNSTKSEKSFSETLRSFTSIELALLLSFGSSKNTLSEKLSAWMVDELKKIQPLKEFTPENVKLYFINRFYNLHRDAWVFFFSHSANFKSLVNVISGNISATPIKSPSPFGGKVDIPDAPPLTPEGKSEEQKHDSTVAVQSKPSVFRSTPLQPIEPNINRGGGALNLALPNRKLRHVSPHQINTYAQRGIPGLGNTLAQKFKHAQTPESSKGKNSPWST